MSADLDDELQAAGRVLAQLILREVVRRHGTDTTVGAINAVAGEAFEKLKESTRQAVSEYRRAMTDQIVDHFRQEIELL